ncbi:MAG: hypothetical protein NVSMB19_04920 [Vulcanimicrobiaceae bacterium]
MRKLLFDVARVGVREERVEIRRVGGDVEPHRRASRGRARAVGGDADATRNGEERRQRRCNAAPGRHAEP